MTAVILWALAVTVVILVHGTAPHGAHAAAVLASIQADHPALSPCPASRSTDRLRHDPGDGGRPTPWGHCDAVLHRAPAPPSGPGAQPLRPSTAQPAGPSADPRGTAPRRADRPARHAAQPEPATLQVFRC
ncbi:hypothetical protein NE235_16885 [Actinoallomurus spadix]|uniref:Secreted protein n=1 Tax=Actinoallomurus spadix TaxID=79912 RepID=A0ABP3H604_9ACTN|nr:hypothetical protein [Actinoallomurus spadix]MCO5987777.1 hypothetical protein [Actinoallomurus spadix]